MTKKTIKNAVIPQVGQVRFFIFTVCSLESWSWLQTFFIPCPFKALTGIDCPGCGFQRSLFAGFQGNWSESFALYPPLVPLLVLLAYGMFKWIFGFDRRNIGLTILGVAVGWLVILAYVLKLWGVFF